MFIKNIHYRELFIPTITGVGTLFQAGETKEIADVYRQDKVVNSQILAGKLLVLSYDPDPFSVVIHDEVTGGGGGDTQTLQLQEQRHGTASTTFTVACQAAVDFSRLNFVNVQLIWNQQDVPSGPDSAEVRLFNATDSVVLGTLTGITSTGLKSITIVTSPVGTKLVEVQHRVTGGTPSRIEGASIFAGS